MYRNQPHAGIDGYADPARLACLVAVPIEEEDWRQRISRLCIETQHLVSGMREAIETSRESIALAEQRLGTALIGEPGHASSKDRHEASVGKRGFAS